MHTQQPRQSTQRLIPPGPHVFAHRARKFEPVEGKDWELAVRELTDPNDWIAMAGALAKRAGPNNLHTFLCFCELTNTPDPGQRVAMVLAQLDRDKSSSLVEIGTAANWCMNQYMSANLEALPWAERFLGCAAGAKEAARLAAATYELERAFGAFEREALAQPPHRAKELIAAVLGMRIRGSEENSSIAQAMERSSAIFWQLWKEMGRK